MLSCWSIDAAERPRFSDLFTTLSGLLERDAGYLQLSRGSVQLELSQSLNWNKKSIPLESLTPPSLPIARETVKEQQKQQVAGGLEDYDEDEKSVSAISKCLR